MVGDPNHDYYLSQPTSTPPQLHRSLVPPVDKIPPHLLTSSPPHLHTSTPPHLHRSLVPPVDKIPPHLHTSTPPHLHTSTALWYPQWTKYLHTSSPPHLHHSLAPQVVLSGASRGNLHLLSSATSGHQRKKSFPTTMVINEYEDKRKQMLDQDYCQASTAACECGAKSVHRGNILPHLSPSE